MADEVLYDVRDRVAVITLNRPEYANAQNSAMTYALDAAFARAVDDEAVAVLVLTGAGRHFCGGHDIGTPERDADRSFDRQAVLWWVLGPRLAREVLFTGGRFSAERAYQAGMVNRVVPRPELEAVAFELAGQIAEMPAFGLALAKRAVNQCEDQMGMRTGMDAVFGLHHLAHAHNAEVSGHSLAGLDARGMKASG